MTRNQKIALGCGGAGCLGLIVVVVAVALIFYFSTSNGIFSYSGSNSSNRNSNSSNSNDDTTNSNDNDNSSSSSSSVASSLSDDEKHKLYQAAGMTGDTQLIRRVSVKLGLMNDDFTPGDNFRQFVIDHVNWAIKNQEFIQSISTEEKAREYVNNNFPE